MKFHSWTFHKYYLRYFNCEKCFYGPPYIKVEYHADAEYGNPLKYVEKIACVGQMKNCMVRSYREIIAVTTIATRRTCKGYFIQ